MKHQNIIFVSLDQCYRIVEVPDYESNFDDLCGDTFNPFVNTDIDPSILFTEQERFKRSVETDGVFGYILEKWNPSPNIGWEHVNSCFGFVGSYNLGSVENNHYIVAEFIAQVPKPYG